jgi:hypothetical protein
MSIPEIIKVLDSFQPVGLDEMDNVRLMDRIDTKFVLSITKMPEMLLRLDGAYMALEINGSKVFSYKTTYLDTVDYMFYNQHITGRIQREKVRYRNYENTGTTFLEVKKRTNKNRTVKWRIENDLTSDNLCDAKASQFIQEYVPQKSLLLEPVLVNNFKRITLVSSEFNERVTIDYDLSFNDMKGNITGFPFLAIIELKRKGFASRSPVGNILKEYSVHPTGFSKYCIGTSILHNPPRKNILKSKFLLINKIENEYNRSVYA